jgi:acyl carrier protein
VNVADEVKLAISNELKIPIDRLSDDTRLDELGAESIDIIEIVFALEEKFNIDISLRMNQAPGDDQSPVRQSDLSSFAAVGDICRAVQVLVDAKAAQ